MSRQLAIEGFTPFQPVADSISISCPLKIQIKNKFTDTFVWWHKNVLRQLSENTATKETGGSGEATMNEIHQPSDTPSTTIFTRLLVQRVGWSSFSYSVQ